MGYEDVCWRCSCRLCRALVRGSGGQRERPHPTQNGEGEGVDVRLGGIDVGRLDFSLALSHILRVCLERFEGGEKHIRDIIGCSENYAGGGNISHVI